MRRSTSRLDARTLYTTAANTAKKEPQPCPNMLEIPHLSSAAVPLPLDLLERAVISRVFLHTAATARRTSSVGRIAYCCCSVYTHDSSCMYLYDTTAESPHAATVIVCATYVQQIAVVVALESQCILLHIDTRIRATPTAQQRHS